MKDRETQNGVEGTMHREALEKACADYLLSTPGAKRFLDGLWNQYVRLGRFGGTITITKPTAEEVNFAISVLHLKVTSKDAITVRLTRIEKWFDQTRFEGVDWLSVLEHFFKKIMVTKEQQGLEAVAQRVAFISELKSDLSQDFTLWLEAVLANEATGSNNFWRQYQGDPVALRRTISEIAYAVSLLPAPSQMPTMLPMLATAVTKNPHSFDGGTQHRYWLLSYFAYREGGTVPNNHQDQLSLLTRGGIVIDLAWRATQTYGLEGFDQQGRPLGWSEFSGRGEILTLNLTNLLAAVTIRPAAGFGQTRIICYENPSVFMAAVMGGVDGAEALICTGGQLHQMDLVLLERLIASNPNVTLYYTGDYDPEGLGIAARLKLRFGERLVLLHYQVSDYEKCLSNEVISEQRLKQLDGDISRVTELSAVAERMKLLKLAGYQEQAMVK